MREPPDLRELIGEDVTAEERERLARADAILRRVPAPPQVPATLDRAVERIGAGAAAPWTRRRTALAVALAAALAALFFGLGRWTEGGEPNFRATIEMTPVPDTAPQASATIKVGERDPKTGNWGLRLVVDGLPELGGDGHYVLWLAKDGDYAGTCGTFRVSGRTTVDMTVGYRLRDFDAWVISEARDDAPWLLSARIES